LGYRQGCKDLYYYEAPIKFAGAADQNDGKIIPQTSEYLERTARLLSDEKHRKDMDGVIGARVTISSLNINRQKELIDYFSSHGIKTIYGDAIFAPVSHNL
jgi:hypothetical protein